MKILSLLLPLALRLMSKYLDKTEQDHKLKDSWMAFIYEMNNSDNESVKINRAIRDIMTKQYKKDMKQ